MFALNKKTITKNGEIVIPYLVENTTVYCQTESGNILYKNLEDFNFELEKQKLPKIISVSGKKAKDIIVNKPITKVESNVKITNNLPKKEVKIANNDIEEDKNEVKETEVKNVKIKENENIVYDDYISSKPILNEDYI
jgi:hypothetical protein